MIVSSCELTVERVEREKWWSRTDMWGGKKQKYEV